VRAEIDKMDDGKSQPKPVTAKSSMSRWQNGLIREADGRPKRRIHNVHRLNEDVRKRW
jgi:hypothetical protein